MARLPYIGPTTLSAGTLEGIGKIGSDYRAANAKEAMDKEIMEGLKSNDPMKMAELSIKYPEMGKQIKDAFGMTSQKTEGIATDTYKRTLSDPDNAAQHLQEGIDRVQEAGGTPTNMQRDLDLYNQNPKAAMDMFNMALASYDGKSYKALVKQREADAKKKTFQQGSGKMSGYVFDQESGSYSIAPETKQRLADKARAEVEKEGKLDVKVTRDINKDVTGLIGGAKDIHDAATSLETLKASSSPVSQLAAVFKLMKALDPFPSVPSVTFIIVNKCDVTL